MSMSIRRFTELGLATAMLALTSGLSDAADAVRPGYRAAPPIRYVYNWTGFYVGAHAGVGWSDGNGSSGLVGGGQVGFNYQINQWVIGAEADIAGTTIKDSVSATVVGPGSVITG